MMWMNDCPKSRIDVIPYTKGLKTKKINVIPVRIFRQWNMYVENKKRPGGKLSN